MSGPTPPSNQSGNVIFLNGILTDGGVFHRFELKSNFQLVVLLGHSICVCRLRVRKSEWLQLRS